MSNTKGVKTRKPRKPRQPRKVVKTESLGAVEPPQTIADWLRISRGELMRRIYTQEIPEDCWFRSGRNYKLIVSRVASHFGING